VKVALITMPWGALNSPSLALSTLRPCVAGLPAVGSADIWYGNLRWAERIADRHGMEPAINQYNSIADGYFVAAGEWVFSGALYGYQEPESTRFYRLATEKGIDLADASDLYRAAGDFIKECADELLEDGYDTFGFTTTFLQNVPSLALAREIKSRSPDSTVIFGGANCDGIQGAALHRCFQFLDYVVRGEGEAVFPALLEWLVESSGTAPTALPGLCWRDDSSRSVTNPTQAVPLPMARVPSADVSGYFKSLRQSELDRYIEPQLVLEGSRGCWWGAKHHCTFCGLNGDLMQFRAKPADRLYREIIDTVSETQVLDISLADNILDMAHLRDLIPRLAAADLDIRLFCEIKSNLTYDQLEHLARAKVMEVQPGIENLNSRVLGLMRKGVSGTRNVELLRNCETLGIGVSWNYLYGFPGETDPDYTGILKQATALIHLQPPSAAFRVALERFSPYFEDRQLGLRSRGPAQLFAAIYQLPAENLAELVYLFESEPAGISDKAERDLLAAADRWRAGYRTSELSCVQDGRRLVVLDRRAGGPTRDYVLATPLQVAAYRALFFGRTVGGLRRQLADEHAIEADESAVGELLDEWLRLGLVFTESNHYVALATGSDLRPPSARHQPCTASARREGRPDDSNRSADRNVFLPLSSGSGAAS
jgi:ribosomal peptide maturation radical SAM protein 1